MINLCVAIKQGSTKQCVEPESTSALKIKAEIKTVVMERNKASGLKGVEALRRTSVARLGSTQPMVCVESERLLTIFLSPQLEESPIYWTFLSLHVLWLSKQKKRILDILWQYVLHLHRKGKDYLRSGMLIL